MGWPGKIDVASDTKFFNLISFFRLTLNYGARMKNILIVALLFLFSTHYSLSAFGEPVMSGRAGAQTATYHSLATTFEAAFPVPPEIEEDGSILKDRDLRTVSYSVQGDGYLIILRIGRNTLPVITDMTYGEFAETFISQLKEDFGDGLIPDPGQKKGDIRSGNYVAREFKGSINGAGRVRYKVIVTDYDVVILNAAFFPKVPSAEHTVDDFWKSFRIVSVGFSRDGEHPYRRK